MSGRFIEAICPNTETAERFVLVQDSYGVLCWCSDCRRVFNFEQLIPDAKRVRDAKSGKVPAKSPADPRWGPV